MSKTKTKTKLIKVPLDLFIWERFYKLFPGQGERTRFLRQVVELVVERDFSLRNQNKKAISNLLKNVWETLPTSEGDLE